MNNHMPIIDTDRLDVERRVYLIYVSTCVSVCKAQWLLFLRNKEFHEGVI